MLWLPAYFDNPVDNGYNDLMRINYRTDISGIKNTQQSSTFHSCELSMVEFPSMNALLLNLSEKSELRFDEGADNADCSKCQLPDL